MAYFDPLTKILHGKKVPQIYSPLASLGQVLLFNFFKSPDKVIQTSDDDGVEVKCSEMASMMSNIAQNLYKLGYKFGDVAGFLATNTTFVAPAMFACYLLGLPLSPLDVSFNVRQIIEIYRDTKPKLVFCDHDMVEKLIKALELMKSDARIVILTDKVDGLMHIQDLLEAPKEAIELPLDLGNSDDVCAAILCTSGTSGAPKLALVSHAQFLQIFTLNQFHEESFSLNFSSLYWLTGTSHIIYQTINLHKRLITSKQFSPDLCFDLIEKYKLRHVFLLPPHVTLFVESPRFKTADLSSIDVFTTGGLYVTEQVRRTLQSRLPNGKLLVALGMTEVGGIVAETDPNDPISSSVGKPAVNSQIKIQIDDGTIGGIYEIGEVLVKKTGRFLGYFGNRHPSILDHYGWVHTGDMGIIDEKFDVNVVGPRTFAIKNFYNEIYPQEIEEVVETVPGVASVCVVGTPDPQEIEVPSAVIVKSPNSQITEDAIKASTDHLPPFKRIRDVFFVESFPTTTSGKFQRRVIKQMAEDMKMIALGKRVEMDVE